MHAPGEAARALEGARARPRPTSRSPDVYVEKYVEDPPPRRGAGAGATRTAAVVHLGERDCTLQRRHQKVVEESPLAGGRRRRCASDMGAMAVDAAHAVGYVGAGTRRVPARSRMAAFYFLEMNTRIQVEHPVTELVDGLDLVRAQIEIAAGEPLGFDQGDVGCGATRSNAASTPRTRAPDSCPAPGRITRYREPAGPGVRVDAGVEQGSEVVGLYDPMVAKLVVWDEDRPRAIARMRRALDEMVVEGVATLLPLHRLILAHPAFAAGETCAGLVEGALAQQLAPAPSAEPAAPPVAERRYDVEVDGRRFDVAVLVGGDERLAAERRRREERRARGGAGGPGGETVTSPMQGTVLRVEVAEGDAVEAGAVLVIVEAMKMENEILAHTAGVVTGLTVTAGDPVRAGQVLCNVTVPASP